jgi:shikimate kinase
MMGAGKSTVGPALARRLMRRFVDTDVEIERAAHRTVAEIFAQEGEPAFRARERAVVGRWAGREVVASLGGGAPAQPGMRERLARTGVLVHLRARSETLLARLGDCRDRPLLAGLTSRERRARLEALLAERSAAYAFADVVVDVDHGSPDGIAARVAALLPTEGRA